MTRAPSRPTSGGAEYSWKLVNRPIWEVLHGEGDLGLELLQVLDRRHGCDWVIPLHASSGALQGKTLVREDRTHVYFADDLGDEWVFHKEAHWLVRASEAVEARLDHQAPNVDPPHSRAEADDWLRRHYPHLSPDQAASDLGILSPSKCARHSDRRLRDRFPDRFLCASMPAPFAGLAYTMGFEPALLLLHEDPSLCAYMLERTLADMPGRCAQLAADGFDGGMMCDSWASADIISPETYANWIAPLHRLISDELHRAGLKSIIYNTGNILPLLDTIAALGYDAISPEERIKGVEMDIGGIRRAVGPDVCLFGNFDSYLLLSGDRDAIRREVRRQITAAGPHYFIMGTGSPLCGGTDPEVIDWWVRVVREAC